MKIFLDACAIIYWVEAKDLQFNQFAKKLKEIRTKYPACSFAVSYLSLLECRVKPLKENNKKLLEDYQQFFCARDLTLIELTSEVIETATYLRAFSGLRTPDAIQAASALSISDEIFFVTADKTFKKIPQLNVLLL